MKILKLEAENVKRLRAVEITPDGHVVVVGGRNAQGKTSVLDSIAMALGGQKLCPERPIRDGEESATARVELDELIVTRRWTAGGSRLTVESKDGAQYKSPQAVLDKLVGSLCFDPLEFSRLDARRQRQLLCDVTGLDTTDLDAEQRRTFDQRTIINRDIKRFEAQINGMPGTDDPVEPIDTKALLRQLDEVRAHNHQIRARTENADRIRRELDYLAQKIAEMQQRLTALLTEKQEVDAALASMQPKDEEEIKQKLAGADTHNRQVMESQQRAFLRGELRGAKAAADNATKRLIELEEQKKARVAAAKMPLADLTVDDGQVLYRGLPLSQASSAEQLRISVAIGLALNPQLRVMLVRDGSLLDDDALFTLGEMAQRADAQVWVERVGEGDECHVVIEDGTVKERNVVAA